MRTLSPRLCIGLLVAIAVVLRAAALSAYSIHHADEAVQYLEQAHRLVFADGLVPWEYRAGMRSWLIPLLLAGPMWLGEVIAPQSILYILLPRSACAILAFAPVPAAYFLGARISRMHGIVAMGVMGLWSESVYFSVHVLTEPLAVAGLLSAAALLQRRGPAPRLIAAGALCALAVLVRFHYGPAIALFLLVAVRNEWRDWRMLAVGALIVAIIAGAIDAAMGQIPFAWIYHNIDQNLIKGHADRFGTDGPEAYLLFLLSSWGLALPVILLLACFGARRHPALAAAALCNLAVHLLIGHKEYRFILLSTQISVLLAAFQSVDVMAARFRRGPGDAVLAWQPASAALACWALTSAILASFPHFGPDWRSHAGGMQLGRQAGKSPAICGLAVIGTSYWASGARSFLHAPRVELFFPVVPGAPVPAEEAISRTVQGYNAILAPADDPSIPSDFQPVACHGSEKHALCLYQRPGTCRPDSASDAALMQQQMDRYGS